MRRKALKAVLCLILKKQEQEGLGKVPFSSDPVPPLNLTITKN